MTDIVKISLRHRVVKSSIWTLRFLQVGFHVLIYHNYDHIKYFPRQSVKQLWERGGGGHMAWLYIRKISLHIISFLSFLFILTQSQCVWHIRSRNDFFLLRTTLKNSQWDCFPLSLEFDIFEWYIFCISLSSWTLTIHVSQKYGGCHIQSFLWQKWNI